MNSSMLDALCVPNGQRVDLQSYPTDEVRWGTHSLGSSADKAATEEQTQQLQEQLSDMQERLYAEGQQSLLIVLQARDGGGKDSTVKRVMGALNPSGVQVVSFKEPTPLELRHDFLWRIHQQAPARGMVAVFNRSHYEDVLVTRVHGLIDEKKVKQNLQHIVNFEQLLADAGTRIVKIYLHLSPEEQAKRFQDRLNDPTKHWKFNPGDLEDRVLWPAYTQAYEDALTTSCEAAPWYVVPADRKWLRDYLVSEILLQTLQAMNPQFPHRTFNPAAYTVPEVQEK